MRLIDADALYERLKADEELARNRVIDTPSSFPNGAVNPSAIRYMAQLSERTRFKEIVFDAPTIERKKGKWVDRKVIDDRQDAKIQQWQSCKCSICGRYDTRPYLYYFDEPRFCSWCGADMRGETWEH